MKKHYTTAPPELTLNGYKNNKFLRVSNFKFDFIKSLLIIFLLLPVLCKAQYKFQPIPTALMFVAGASKGYADVLKTHYYKFKEVHPNANDNFWDASVSWKNKWADDSYTTEKYLGSSTVFVSLTDGWHMANSFNKVALVGAVTIKLGHKQPFRYYLYDFAIYTLSYSLGFSLVYEGIYR